jgi:hypothetical protein
LGLGWNAQLGGVRSSVGSDVTLKTKITQFLGKMLLDQEVSVIRQCINI